VEYQSSSIVLCGFLFCAVVDLISEIDVTYIACSLSQVPCSVNVIYHTYLLIAGAFN